jgi:ubiquinone/menaquinone biosynthesis C-methylase UbiE
MAHRSEYIPALGLRAFTPLYDPVLRWFFREDELKQQLIAAAALAPGQHVLDLGCGTGTLIVMIKQVQPLVTLTGLDGDADVLAIARTKVAGAGLDISFSQALASSLPYPDDTFDRVLSSLVFHHLSSKVKRAAFSEIYRVLRPGGELHILDFGAPDTKLGKVTAPIIRHLEQAADNIDGLLPAMASEAGFGHVELIQQETVLAVATVAHLRARKHGIA